MLNAWCHAARGKENLQCEALFWSFILGRRWQHVQPDLDSLSIPNIWNFSNQGINEDFRQTSSLKHPCAKLESLVALFSKTLSILPAAIDSGYRLK